MKYTVWFVSISVLATAILGCGSGDKLSCEDTRFHFGEQAFAVITRVDNANPREVLLEGIAGIQTRGPAGSLVFTASPTKLTFVGVLSEADPRKSKDTAIMSTSLPGTVLVVGVREGVTIGDKHFGFRQILLLNSKFKHVLAPPGFELTVPADVEILGRTYGKGTFVVPDDSRFPEPSEQR